MQWSGQVTCGGVGGGSAEQSAAPAQMCNEHISLTGFRWTVMDRISTDVGMYPHFWATSSNSHRQRGGWGADSSAATELSGQYGAKSLQCFSTLLILCLVAPKYKYCSTISWFQCPRRKQWPRLRCGYGHFIYILFHKRTRAPCCNANCIQDTHYCKMQAPAHTAW